MSTIKALFIPLTALVACGCQPVTVDRVGGVRLTYPIEAGQQFSRSELEKAVVRRLQVGGFDYAEAHVTVDDLLLVELPGADEEKSRRAQEMLAGSGRLELRIVAERGAHDEIIGPASAENAPTGETPNVAPQNADSSTRHDGEDKFLWVRFDEQRTLQEDWMVLRDNPGGGQDILMVVSPEDVTSNDLASAYAGRDTVLQPCLNGSLNRNGARKMQKLTGDNIGRRLAIVFDGTLMTAPVVRSAVADRFQLTGKFTEDEVKSMAAILQTGAFPAKFAPIPIQQQTVQPK